METQTPPDTSLKNIAPITQMRDLELLVTARHPLIAIETLEEDRATALLMHLADNVNLPYFRWTPTKGLFRPDTSTGSIYGTTSAGACLDHIETSGFSAIYHLQGMHAHLEERLVIARLREIADKYSSRRGAIVFTLPETELPREIEPLFAFVRLEPPTDEEYYQFISNVVRDLRTRMLVRVQISSEEVGELINHLRGLTLFEVKKIITQTIVDTQTLSRDAITKIIEAKRKIIERSGVLEFFPVEASMDEVAGLDALKDWLRKRSVAFKNPETAKQYGLESPKGVLLLGVQGCGKSMCAKAVAGEWSLPLIRLDPANLYQKYLGESEKNLKRAIHTAEAMAPIVLWIDEIEKAFGQNSEDGGASQRIFGTFLSWMQDKQSDVFVVATSNDISKLPPELLRKGRFDEIFFVDLPDEETRIQILEVHLKRRNQEVRGLDLLTVAQASDGFSGAELEQVVISGLYSAFSRSKPLSTELLLEEVAHTKPLSVTMAEKVASLRAWARNRAIYANERTRDSWVPR